MKNYLRITFLLALFFFVKNTGWSQQIHFADKTNKWKTRTTIYPNDEPIVSTDIFEMSDSLYEWNGHFYTAILSEGNPVLFIREDTIARKVFVAPITNHVGYYLVTDMAAEFVYMDFSLTEGDTFSFPLRNESSNPEDTMSQYRVGHIDSVQIGNNWHKRMRMERISGIGYLQYDSYLITEGIGFGLNHGFGGPVIGTDYSSEWPPQLACFMNKGVIPYPPFYSNCFDPESIDETRKSRHDFLMYPNPSVGIVHLHFTSAARNRLVQLSDITGRIMLSQRADDFSLDLDITRLPEGIYFIKSTGDNTVIVRKKLILQ